MSACYEMWGASSAQVCHMSLSSILAINIVQYYPILSNIVQLYPILVTSPNIAITNINHQWLYSIAVEFNSLIYKDLCAIVTEQLVFCLGDPPSVEGASKMVTSWCNFWNRLFFLWFEKIFDTFVLKEAAPWVARSIFSSWKRLQWAYVEYRDMGFMSWGDSDMIISWGQKRDSKGCNSLLKINRVLKIMTKKFQKTYELCLQLPPASVPLPR